MEIATSLNFPFLEQYITNFGYFQKILSKRIVALALLQDETKHGKEVVLL